VATVASLRRSSAPATCDECGYGPVAPDFAEYFSDGGLILYLWRCPRCGHRFETEFAAEVSPQAARQAIAAFWPSLLVA